jgi:S1-C subfamily serine protease
MCAVMLAIAGCASNADFLSERTIEQAGAISTPPAPVKTKTVSYREHVAEPGPTPPVALPTWKAAAAIKPPAASNAPLSPTSLFEKVGPSVYGVKVKQEAGPKGAVSYGSAVAVSPREAITNCHVVSQGKLITLSNGATTLPAEVSAADRRTDRCYLKVTNGTLEPVIGSRGFDSLVVGETVYTIGSPKGLDRTLGQGLLSGLRKMEGVEYVQITAPVSEGSSGGGLFDDRGNLIGITTFTVRDSQNLNFAIAASEYWNTK